MRQRHPRLSEGSSRYLAEVARVALSRHHTPPRAVIVEIKEESRTACEAAWTLPSAEQCASHANTDDSTRDGAYCLALAAIEFQFGLHFISRTERRSGADYFVHEDKANGEIESATRFEVSGIDNGQEYLNGRLAEKLGQLKNGNVSGPGVAAIVGFSTATILLKEARDG